jgi:hypothetical protein
MLQFYIGKNLIPMSKMDTSNYPLDFYYSQHGFVMGEPKYSANYDMPFTIDAIPYYNTTAKWGTTALTDGTAGTDFTYSGGANNILCNGTQTDVWNTSGDGYTYSRANSIFQWSNNFINFISKRQSKLVRS